MSSSDFRQIAIRSEAGKAERLFRAAVSAFCSLTRPTRADAAQLDALALPLYDRVSPEARRYVAAALSECRRPPLALVRRLADEPEEIAAAVLMRSAALSDFDLVGLIGRHGLGHARAIVRRPHLNPSIAALIAALEATAPATPPLRGENDAGTHVRETTPMTEPSSDISARPPSPAEATRTRLRAMMAVGGTAAAVADPARPVPGGDTDLYRRLRATALSGTLALFQTALADALRIGFPEARALVAAPRYEKLLEVLRGLDLSAEQAFLLAAAVSPKAFPHADSMRRFVDTFERTQLRAGRETIRRLQDESTAVAAGVAVDAVVPKADLKAS